MTKHIPVPEELLHEFNRYLQCRKDSEWQRDLINKLRDLLDGPGVEPVAYRGTAFPGSKDFTYDESEQVLREFGCVEIDPLCLAAPQHPATTDKENEE